MRGMLIDNKFELGQTVYLKTDPDQLPRLVTGLKILPGMITYCLTSGTGETGHYDIEIATERNELIAAS